MPPTRRGLEQATYREEKKMPFRPVLGMWTADPAQEIPDGASPDMLNLLVFKGMLVKRPGYVQFSDGNSALGNPVLALFSLQDNEDATHLYALTKVGVFKYNTGTDDWDALTGTALTGTDDDHFSGENSENSFVFSQGVDKVQVIDFAGASWTDLDTNAVPARVLCRFNNRLNLGYTLESGDHFPRRHRRPVSGDHTDWTGLGSGFRDQDEFPTHLRNMRKLSNQMYLYYQTMIEAAIPQPVAAVPFRYETRIAEIGLLAARTLTGRLDHHAFLGTESFYKFNGVQVEEIMGQVRESIFETLNAGVLHQFFGITLADFQSHLFFLATTGNDYPNNVWVFNWQRGITYPWSVSGHRCACVHRLDGSTTFDEAVGTFDEQTQSFDSLNLSAAFPAFLTGHNDGKIYQWGREHTSDDGMAITCRYTSKEYTSKNVFDVPEQKINLDRIGFRYLSTGSEFTLTFSVSTDGGQTWTHMESVTAGSDLGEKIAFVNIKASGNRIRFKFENATDDETFSIIDITPEFSLEKTKTFES